MSTTAIVKVYDEDNALLCRIYVHGDGYPDVLGRLIYNFTREGVYTNGIPSSPDPKRRYFNGMGSYATQLIEVLSASTPSRSWAYLLPLTLEEDDYVNYSYLIKFDVEERKIRVFLDRGGELTDATFKLMGGEKE